MANFKEIKNELIKFGLSEKQALIYLLLVQHGELRIQEISNLAGVPRSSVYENLKVLFKLELVEKIVDDKFVIIRAYAIGSIKHGLNEKLINLQGQLSKLDHLEKSISLLPKLNSSKPTIVRYYKDVAGARQLMWNTLNAKDTVLVYSGWGRSSYVGMKFYKSFVSESYDRQIQEKVLVNPTSHVLESIRKYTGTSTARTAIEDIRALNSQDVFMKGETFIYNNIFAQIYLKDEEINGFEIESSSFVETQRSIFETLWKISKPVVELL
jgi:sugar-specific transcriptional regulator TrmB